MGSPIYHDVSAGGVNPWHPGKARQVDKDMGIVNGEGASVKETRRPANPLSPPDWVSAKTRATMSVGVGDGRPSV